MTYLLIWTGIGTIVTLLVAKRRGHDGLALILWLVLGAALGIFAILLALASSGSGDGKSFRLTK